jgi:hypothetical protein
MVLIRAGGDAYGLRRDAELNSLKHAAKMGVPEPLCEVSAIAKPCCSP